MPTFPARVHPILARKSDEAVIIRRGPSKAVCTMLWDRRKDTFKLGQWLRGRIYERRCDLSPDGKYFIYFAMNGKWDGPVNGSWSAISRAPYLKALALWPWGDCWNGGGLFLSGGSFWLNNHWYDEATEANGRLDKKLVREPGFPFEENYGGECPGVYYHRLQRDGWKLRRRDLPPHGKCVAVFEKSLAKGWILEKSAHASIHHPVGRGCYYDTHRLIQPESGTVLNHPDWEWAELDRKRLAWVEKGVLYAAQIHRKGLGEVKVLHDFNEMEFEAIAAPY
jgi:hypothetical protein